MSERDAWGPGWTVAAFLVVAAGTLVLALPGVLTEVALTADALGYVATAHDWLEGKGFVDPIVYSYYLPGLRPPAPASTAPVRRQRACTARHARHPRRARARRGNAGAR